MSITKLTKFEWDVLKHVLNKECVEYLSHLSQLFVAKREFTGVGCYVDFLYLGDPPIKTPERKTLGIGTNLEIQGLECGAGVILYIDDGHITLLECFCHGSEEWPNSILHYAVRNAGSEIAKKPR